MSKEIWKYGMIGSAGLIALMLLMYSFNGYENNLYTISSYANLIIVFLTIHLGIKEIRNVSYQGEIRYKNAVVEGLKIVLIMAVLHSASILIYFTVNSGKLKEYKEYTLKTSLASLTEARKTGKMEYTDKDIQKFRESIQNDFTAFNLAKYNIIYILLFGLIFSLISAMILRKKDAEPGLGLESK